MHLLTGLSTALLSTVMALPSRIESRFKQHINVVEATLAFKIADFQISNIQSVSTFYSENATQTTSISFLFMDPNSNTSAICSDTFFKTLAQNGSTTSDTTPYGPSYVRCVQNTSVSESFIWHFNTFTSPESFTLQLAHEFQDPIHYPPPYSTVEYFAHSTNITLVPNDAAGESGFHLPSSSSPVLAVVDSISN